MFNKVEFNCIVIVECYVHGKEPGVSCKDQAYRCRFYKIRELIVLGDLVLEKVHTSDNAVDMLTTPFTVVKFKHYLDLIHISRC